METEHAWQRLLLVLVRDCSLITGKGEHVNFYSHEKGGGGGGGKSLSHAEGGGGEVKKKFPLFKRGGGVRKVLPCLEEGGGAQKIVDRRFNHFVAPLPVINDQSLRRVGQHDS